MNYQIIILCAILTLLNPLTAWTGEELVYSSQDQQVSLMELYVSEGCSSCPPAQKWVSQFIDDPRLWKEIVPIVFHVDYWDDLGWKDPFSSKAHTQRQYQYKTNGKINSVYTPGFVVNGIEWRGWFKQKELPANDSQAGQLTARLESEKLYVTYEGEVSNLILNIVLLGFDFQINVTSGENRNLTIKEDFIVLTHNTYQSQDGQWLVPKPEYTKKNSQRIAIALWVTPKDDIAPLQATGGWLN